MAGKRKDECLFCTSRRCYTRIYRRDVPIFDEVACVKHVEELQNHADKVLGSRNGIYRNHVSGTGTYKRGQVYDWELEDLKKYKEGG